MKHALQNISRNGGTITNDNITIKLQEPKPVAFEQSFVGVYPIAKIPVHWNDAKDEISFDFEGTGFVMRGETAAWESNADFIFNTALIVDGNKIESPQLPANYTTRRYEVCWKYDLTKGKHHVVLKILNPSKEFQFNSSEAIIYSDKPVNGIMANEEAAKK
jgi:hypothetical protein